jgi:hypothetical protein
MKKIFTSLVLCLFFISWAFALDVKKSPTLKESSANSLSIEWEKVEGSIGYYVYYGLVSWIGGSYQNQLPDFVESTGAILQNLESGKNYYISVRALDDAGEEWKYSPEAVFSTKQVLWGQSNSQKFVLESVKVSSANTLDLMFSRNLDSAPSAQRDVKIVKQWQQAELIVTNYTLSTPKTLSLSLKDPLETSSSYNLTVIALQDDTKKSIEAWVDAISNFLTPSSFSSLEPSMPELNSGWPEMLSGTMTPPPTPMSADYSGNAGTIVAQEEINKNTEIAAENTEKLPKTWPEAFLLLFLAWVLWFAIVYYKRKISA